MANAAPGSPRSAQDLILFLEPVLRALLPPLAAEQAAIVALDGNGGAPETLYATGNRAAALTALADLLLAASHAPLHGLDTDRYPVLAGPWQMPVAQQVVLVFWREVGRPWKKPDYALFQTVAAALTACLCCVTAAPRDTTRINTIDKITNLPKARKFVADLPRHFAELDQAGLPGTMILASVDGFSQLCARIGRDDAAEALRRVATLLIRATAPTDLVARMDENEFAIWLNGADHFAAAERAEQLRAEAAKVLAEVSPEQGPAMTLSFGIATRQCCSTETISSILRRVDYAMHEASHSGPGSWRVSEEVVV